MKEKNTSRIIIKNDKTKNDFVKRMIMAKAVLAPLSGITDIPFRLMARRFGCKFAFTEMIDVNGIIYKNKKSFRLLDRIPGDEPLGVQLVGEDIERFVSVAKICEEKGFKLLDINAGCPARKVVTLGKGAALMKDPKKLARIVGRLVKELSIPVTVKIRSGWDENNINYLKVAKAVESEGASAVGFHVRTREQMYKGEVDRSLIFKLKEKINIPVIASGNIFSAEDVKNVFKSTGCDAVFIARGALGRPWIFKEIEEGSREEWVPEFEELKNIIKEHFYLNLEYYDFIHARKRMYKHLTWYLKKYKNLHEIMKEYTNIKDMRSLEKLLKKLRVGEKKKLYL
ncbi:MAG: tRNA dihydrouridine synthase DusB [Candidatus Omnitrophica bacterium]|nr:tRNA dihydrouridine synthase DusB [Candidatus Omnitrophota bacterium]